MALGNRPGAIFAEIDKTTAELRRQIKVIEDGIRERYAAADTASQEAINAANMRLARLTEQVRQRFGETRFSLPDRPEPHVGIDCRVSCTTRGATGSTS